MDMKTMRSVPIKVSDRLKIHRTPIKASFNDKMKLKLRELQYLTQEEDILELSEYYNYLAAKALNRPAYHSLYLTNQYKQHKNWEHFESVWEICRMKGWDRNLYLEAQFERAKDWKYGIPYPNMLYSVPALRYFTTHLARIKRNREKDLGAKGRERSVQITDRRKRLVAEITKSIQTLSLAILNSKQPDLKQYKVLRVYQSWDEMSPYYLWSIPWFEGILPDLEGVKADEVRDTFKMISSSQALREEIQTLVDELEEKYNIPPNIKL